MVTRKRILIAATFVLITALAQAVHGLVADLPDPRTLIARAPSGTSKLLDRNGRLLYEFLDPHAGSRTRVDLAQIPLACCQATVATEDANFYVSSQKLAGNSGVSHDAPSPSCLARSAIKSANLGIWLAWETRSNM